MISFDHQKASSKLGPVILLVWVAFTSIYTLMSFGYPFIQAKQIESARQTGYIQGSNDAAQQALQSFSGNIFQNGQTQGQQIVVNQLVQELAAQFEAGCTDLVPVAVGTGSIGILSAACFQQLTQQATADAQVDDAAQ